MKKTLVMILILFLASINFGQEKEKEQTNTCISCHQENEMMPEDYNAFDVHYSAGLTCADCHGGNPKAEDEEDAMSRRAGFVGAPSRKEMPKFCGKCHSDINYMKKYNPRIETDQVARYYTSIHGIQLKKGDENIAVCSSCHTAHSILPAKDARSTTYAVNLPSTCNNCHGDESIMSQYGLPSDIYEKYSKSVHGIALLENRDTGAPSCNDCHGNHGAVPPGVHSIAYVCGTCHVNNMNLFVESKMGKAFEENEFHGCVECHSNHFIEKPTDEYVGTSEKAFCINCHEDGEKGYEAAQQINSSITTLAAKYDSAETILDEVKTKGMNDIDIGFVLKDAKQKLIQSRTAVHSFNVDKVLEKTDAGDSLTVEAINMANAEIDEYFTRRNGFAAATLIFTILIIGLYMKIKDMDKEDQA